MNSDPSVGNWIKLKRKSLGLSQADLAEKVGRCLEESGSGKLESGKLGEHLGERALRYIESNQSKPTPRHAKGLALALEIVTEQHNAYILWFLGKGPYPDRSIPSGPPLHLPTLVIGREDDLYNLRVRLMGAVGDQSQVLTAVHGWPGVGKTTIAAALAHDPDINNVFPDGVLWTSLDQTPNLFAELIAWGRRLGEDLQHTRTIIEASNWLAALLHNRHMLLIVDDVWEPEHAIPFRVGGRGCAMLVTTRARHVAATLAPPNAIYKLGVLTDEQALKLMRTLAPAVVTQHPEPCLTLARELQGLPLALQVAGRLLNTEASYGLDVSDLITELREGTRLLKEKAPPELADLMRETTPTVAALLQKSVDRLDEHTRNCFAYLGVVAAKPATFHLTALKDIWQANDPKPIVGQLLDRGLIEPVGADRFQMHALLVMYARSLLTE